MGDISVGEFLEPTYVPSTKLSEIKEPFFDNLAMVIWDLSTPKKQAQFSKVCWKNKLFQKCFDFKFHRDIL